MTMEWGLMWQHEDVSLEERVKEGALRYREKYGHRPNTCFVYEDLEDPIMVAGMDVMSDPRVGKDTIWIGVSV